jgi:TolB protein
MKKLLVIMLLLSVSRFSFAVLTIEITKGSDSALPIAVVPFVNKTGLPISQDVSSEVVTFKPCLLVEC